MAGFGGLCSLIALAALAALTLHAQPTHAQTAPSVTGVAITSDAGSDQTYAKDETIRVTLTFSESVEVSGTPQLAIDMDPADWGKKWAGYASGSGTSSLTFAHTVVEPNLSTQGIAVLADSLRVNGGSITSSSSGTVAALAHSGLGHNASHKVDWQHSPPAPVVPTPPPGAPTVTSVSISSDAGDDNTYARGEIIRVVLTFSEAVDVTGTPQLKIDMDSGDWGVKTVDFEQGSGATLTFAYTVAEPNLSTQGIAVVGDSLALNGGSIQSTASQTVAALSHSGLSHDPSHKVDWQQYPPGAPTVTAVAISSDAGYNETYALGDVIRISLTFSEAVDVTGTPQLKIDMDPAEWGEKSASYETGTGSTSLIFAYTVAEPNFSSNGIAVLANTLALNGGTIKSSASQTDAALAHAGLSHDSEHKVDWGFDGVPPDKPTVVAVTLSSAAGSDRSYMKGEAIKVTVQWSEAVNVNGTPRLKLDFRSGSGDEQWAGYESGSGEDELVFAYTVAQGDDSEDGVAVVANSLELNGGTIVAADSTSDNAVLTHTGLARNSNHRVDCTPPTLLSAVANGTTVTLTFSEALGAATSLSNDDFTIVRTPQGGSEAPIALSGAPSISSVSVTLTLSSAISATDTDVKVSYTKPTSGDNNKLIDIAGNEVASFSDVSAMEDTTPPRLLSGQIDGDTIILVFSEAMDEDWEGGWFRATVRMYSGATVAFTPKGAVEITGNIVRVGLGTSDYGTKFVAQEGYDKNLVYYMIEKGSDEVGLRDLAGNPLHKPTDLRGYLRTQFIFLENITDGPPRITWAQIQSRPGDDDTYGLGDEITVRLIFNKPVNVIGAPRLKIAFDTGVGARLGDEKWAVYASGSGTAKIDFTYTVAEAENSTNNSTRGIAVLQDSLILRGGAIRSLSSSKNADLAHMGLGHQARHKVDTPLRLKTAELDGTTLTIHFSEALGAAPSLANDAFAVTQTVTGGGQETIALSGSPVISGHTLTLTLASAPSSGNSGVTLSYTKPGTGSDNKLTDAGGGELDSFSGQSIGADVTPPTLVRAEVNGDRLTLVFNEPLDASSNQDQWFRIRLQTRSYSWHEWYFEADVQISGHRVTAILSRGDFFVAKPGLHHDLRAYYFKPNDKTGPGLRDLAGNEVSIPHYNPGFWSTRWVPLENLTGQ